MGKLRPRKGRRRPGPMDGSQACLRTWGSEPRGVPRLRFQWPLPTSFPTARAMAPWSRRGRAEPPVFEGLHLRLRLAGLGPRPPWERPLGTAKVPAAARPRQQTSRCAPHPVWLLTPGTAGAVVAAASSAPPACQLHLWTDVTRAGRYSPRRALLMKTHVPSSSPAPLGGVLGGTDTARSGQGGRETARLPF